MLASSEDLLHTKATSMMTVVGQYPGRLDVTRRHHELVGSSDGLATREPRAPGLPPYTSCGVIPRCMNTLSSHGKLRKYCYSPFCASACVPRPGNRADDGCAGFTTYHTEVSSPIVFSNTAQQTSQSDNVLDTPRWKVPTGSNPPQ